MCLDLKLLHTLCLMANIRGPIIARMRSSSTPSVKSKDPLKSAACQTARANRAKRSHKSPSLRFLLLDNQLSRYPGSAEPHAPDASRSIESAVILGEVAHPMLKSAN